MNIKEFTVKPSAKKLNESLAAKFGSKIDIDRFTTEQLLDARNRLRTKVFNTETTESFNSVRTEEYQKNKLFLDVLNAALEERDDHIIDAIEEAIKPRGLREGAEDQAEIVMAAKDMVNRVTGWLEDTAEMQTESMLELADAIRDEMGSEKSEQFRASIKASLEQLYTTMETTRETLTQGISMLTGEGDIKQPMGADDTMGIGGDDTMSMDTPDLGADDLDLDGDDLDLGVDDDFGADASAAGGEEEMGREKRESRSYTRGKQISEISKKKAVNKLTSRSKVPASESRLKKK